LLSKLSRVAECEEFEAVVADTLIVKNDAWKVTIGATGTLAYLVVAKGNSWEPLLMLCLLIILVIKHFEGLHALPSFRANLFRWVQRN